MSMRIKLLHSFIFIISLLFSFAIIQTSCDNNLLSVITEDIANSGVAKSINLTYPNGGEYFAPGENFTVSWTSSSNDTIKIELVHTGANAPIILSASAPDTGSCLCQFPESITLPSTYVIRISLTSDSSKNDLSDAPFTIDQIRVIAPGEGLTVAPNNTLNISWAFSDQSQPLTIELLKNGDKISDIINNLSNHTSYAWVVPVELEIGDNYAIKIRSISNLAFTAVSPNFSVGLFGVSLPNGGEAFKPGSNMSIQWYSDTTDPVKIELLKGGTVSSTIVESNSSQNYSWFVPSGITHGGDYKIRITSTGSTPLIDSSDTSFSIGNVSLTSPNGANIWVAGEQYPLSWSSAIGGAVDIYLLRDGVADENYGTIVATTDNNSVYQWTIPTELSESASFKIRVCSCMNQDIYDDSDGNFTISTINLNSSDLPLALKLGTNYPILWDSMLGGDIDIDLYANGTKAGDIQTVPTSNGTYTWAANLFGKPEGSTFRIRLTLQATGLPSIYRETTDRSIGSIILGALSKTTWKTGETMTVSWSSAIAGDAIVDLYKGASKVNTITTLSASAHTCQWTVSQGGQAEGVDYKIRISSSLNSEIYSETSAFSIGGIAINSPSGGAYWTDAPCTVTWTSAVLGNIDIDLYRAGSKVKDVAVVPAVNGTYTWSDFTSIGENTGYYLRLSSVSNTAIYSESNQFSLGGITPTLSSNLSFGSPDNVSIPWNSVIGGNADIDLYKGAVKVSDIAVMANTGSYSWTVPRGLDAGTDYSFKISSTLNSDILGTSQTFTIKRWVPYSGTDGKIVEIASSSPSLALRSNNNYPIALLRDSSSYIHLYKWNGSAWEFFTKSDMTEVKPYDSTVSEAKLGLNSSNEPIIGYIDLISGRLGLVKWVSGTAYYSAGLGTSGVVSNMSMAMLANGKAVFSYRNGNTPNNAQAIQWDHDLVWIQLGDMNGDDAIYDHEIRVKPSTQEVFGAVSSDTASGYPRVYKHTTETAGGNWSTQIGGNISSTIKVKDVNLQFNALEQPVVAFNNALNQPCVYAYSGSTWQVLPTVKTSGSYQYLDMKVGSDGNPVLVFTPFGGGTLYLFRYDGSAWIEVPSGITNAKSCTLSLDSQNNAIIMYIDTSNLYPHVMKHHF